MRSHFGAWERLLTNKSRIYFSPDKKTLFLTIDLWGSLSLSILKKIHYTKNRFFLCDLSLLFMV